MMYHELIGKSDEAIAKAREFAEKNDWKMSGFWRNASEGFKIKAMQMKISEIKEKYRNGIDSNCLKAFSESEGFDRMLRDVIKS